MPNWRGVLRRFFADDRSRVLIFSSVVFFSSAVIRLFVYEPVIWHSDAVDFVHAGWQWMKTDVFNPGHRPGFPGWTFLLYLSFKILSLFDASIEIWDLIHASLVLSLFFVSLAAVLVYLLTKTVLGSDFLALALAAVFLLNPAVWRWSSIPMSDIPALCAVLLSFIFFLRFYEKRKLVDLGVASLIFAASSSLRVSTLFLFAPYLIGLIFLHFNKERDAPFSSKLRLLGRDGIILFLPALVAAWLFYGRLLFAPGYVRLWPSLNDIVGTIRWYALRDVGWLWIIFAAAGVAIGLVREKTRFFSLVGAVSIAALLGYYSLMFWLAQSEIERYFTWAIPFTLVFAGFFLKEAMERWQAVTRVLLFLLVLSYGTLVLGGFFFGDAKALENKPDLKKYLLLPSYQAAALHRSLRTYSEMMAVDTALATTIPDGSTLLNDSTNWSFPYFFFAFYPKPDRRIVAVNTHQYSQPVFSPPTVSFRNNERVFIHPSLQGFDLRGLLREKELVFRRKVLGNISVFEKD